MDSLLQHAVAYTICMRTLDTLNTLNTACPEQPRSCFVQ